MTTFSLYCGLINFIKVLPVRHRDYMETVFLLRSYGDFVVSLYHLSDKPSEHKSFNLVASDHLNPLFQSLSPYITPAQQEIEFVDFGFKNQLFSGFTNRHFFSAATIKEFKELQKRIRALDNIVLEQKKRAWLFKWIYPSKVSYIQSEGNIYDAWANYYCHTKSLSENEGERKRVLIFPDSRLQRKTIPESVLQKLESQLKSWGIQPKRGYFKKPNAEISYHNFNDLVNLIANADYVISSDSLPLHIAQFLQKPHAVIYADTINEEWITPYAKKYRTAFTFEEINKQLFKW